MSSSYSTRNRRPAQPKHKKRVSFALADNEFYEKNNETILQKIYRHKFYLFGLCISVLIIAMVLWPSPPFSKQVQHWYDSGYHFKFRNNNIFYQDIVYPPIKLQPVLLIFHGYPTSSYDWKHLIPKFHKNFHRIIIPDFLGLGFSDKPIGYEYSMMEQTSMVEELLDYLNITEVHIMAHDYGDTIAQELLARHNDPNYKLHVQIKSVCLSNGGIIYSQIQLRPIQKALLTPGVKNILAFLANRYLFNFRFSSIFGATTQPSSELLSELWSIILHKEGHVALGDVIRYLPERQKNADRWISALINTNVPLHLIYGPLDPINPPDGFFDTYKNLVKQSTYTILEHSGHYPQFEDAKGFIKGYEKFLKRVESIHGKL